MNEINYRGINFIPEVNKRNTFLDIVKDTPVANCFINAAKRIHDEKNKARDGYDMSRCGKLRKSSKHAEELEEDDLFFGLLGELMVTHEYGLDECWLKEQRKQVEKIKRCGIFDITDIGKTQIRTSCYVERMKLISIIVRPKDFQSKAGQPIIGCVYYPQKKSIKICGWTTLQEIRTRPTQFGSFGGDGTMAFYVAPYDLNPMPTFDEKFLC